LDKGAEASLLIGAMRLRSPKPSTVRCGVSNVLRRKSRENQEQESTAMRKRVKESGICYAVHLSSYGGTGSRSTRPVAGLHSSEQKLNAIGD